MADIDRFGPVNPSVIPSPAPAPRLRRRQARLNRYTRAVGWMKILLACSAVVVVGLIFLIGRDRAHVTDLLSAQEMARLGAGLKLDRPRFAGVTDAGEAFTLRADWALPDAAVPEEIRLENPRGEVDLADGRKLTGEAAEGLMERRDRTLTLTGGVALSTSDGYRFEAEDITVNLDDRSMHTPHPVTGTGIRGQITADSFRALQTGENHDDTRIWFENNVRVVFKPAE
ncbi:MAG: LPS export ABC transporter periplasmic protein LptC [Pseudomonadota bacterium]